MAYDERDREVFRRLASPDAIKGKVKQRQGGAGRKLDYITARTAMNILDEVVGPENWSDHYYEVCGRLFCEISLTLPSGRIVSKSGCGGFKEMMEKGKVDQENTDKTGESDAFKRACVKIGVARSLYKDGTPQFDAYEDVYDASPAPARDDHGDPDRPPPAPRPAAAAAPPKLPQQHLGDASPTDPGVEPEPARSSLAGGPDLSGDKPGVAAFNWLREQDATHGKIDGKPRFMFVNQALKAAKVSKPLAECSRADIEAALAACASEIGLGKADAPSAAGAEGASRPAAVPDHALSDLLSGPPKFLRSWARKVDNLVRWPASAWITGPGGWAERTGQKGRIDDWDASTVAACYHALLLALQDERPEVVNRATLIADKRRVEAAARDLFNVKMLGSPGDALPFFADAAGAGPRTLGELKGWDDWRSLREYAEVAEGVVLAWQIPDSSLDAGLPSGPVSHDRDDQPKSETQFDRLRREAARDLAASKGSKARR